jgi:hypothetical protein
MSTRLFVFLASGIGLLLATAPAWAHHAFAAEFDQNRPLKLKGVVKSWEVTNPHSWIHMDVKKEDGTVEEWAIEGGSPNSLYRLGFTKDSLAPGTEILVDGYQAKDRTNKAVGKNLTLPDGKRLFMGGSAPGANPDDDKKKK